MSAWDWTPPGLVARLGLKWSLLLAAAAVVLVLLGTLQFGGAVKSWWQGRAQDAAITKTVGEIDAVRAAVDKKNAELAAAAERIGGYKKEIELRTREANEAKERARVLGVQAEQLRAELLVLRAELDRVTRERAALKPVTTTKEAVDVLRRVFGF